MPIGYLPKVSYARDLVRREFRLLVTILVLVASLWTFLILAEAVREGTIQQFDDMILVSLRDPDHPEVPRGPAGLEEVMRDITSLGGPTIILINILSVGGYLALRKKYRSILLLVVASVGGGVLDFWLKNLIGRGRPSIVPHLAGAHSLSFPSGHSLMSMVVYLVLAVLLTPELPDRRARVYVIAVALFLTFIIGLSRVYLGVHYPSDVLGGWSIGLAWATICWLVTWYLNWRRLSRVPVTEEQQKEG